MLPVIEGEENIVPAVKRDLPLGNERVLFVDDETEIVDIGSQMLQLLGYRVTGVTDSEKALAIFMEDPNRFDLVITDMTMPKITGDALERQMHHVRPDIPIIVCTGYSEKLEASNFESMGFSAIAYKPLIIEDVARLIRKTMDQP